MIAAAITYTAGLLLIAAGVRAALCRDGGQ